MPLVPAAEARVAAAVVGNELVILNDITQPPVLPPKAKQVPGMPRNSQSVPPPWLVFLISVSGEHSPVPVDNDNGPASWDAFITPNALKPIR